MRESPYFKSIPHGLPWLLGLVVVMAVTGPFGSYGSMRLATRLLYFGSTGGLIWLQVITCAALLGRPRSDRPLADDGTHGPGLACWHRFRARSRSSSCTAWLVKRSCFPPPSRFSPQWRSLVSSSRSWSAFSSSSACMRWPIASAPVSPQCPLPGRKRPQRPISSAACRRHWGATCWPWRWRTITSVSIRPSAATSSCCACATRWPSSGSRAAVRSIGRGGWPREGAVQSVETRRAHLLVLRNGLRVPVSKTFREQVKEAGWLDG